MKEINDATDNAILYATNDRQMSDLTKHYLSLEWRNDAERVDKKSRFKQYVDSHVKPQMDRWAFEEGPIMYIELYEHLCFHFDIENDFTMTGIPTPEQLMKEIVEHIENARKHFANVNEIYNLALERAEVEIKPMSKTTTFETVHLVNGEDVCTMSENDLIEAIKAAEREIEDLSAVKADSKKVKAKIESLRETIVKITKVLDEK